MKKKVSIAIIALLVISLSYGIYGSIKDEDKKALDIGSQHKELLEKKENNDTRVNGLADTKSMEDVIAEVNGEMIHSYELDAAVLSHNMSENNYSEDEILDRIIKNIVLYQKAEEEGIIVSDKEIDKINEDAYEAINSQKETKEFYNAYLEGLGMTLDEYFEYSRESTRHSLEISKLKEKILKDVEVENADSIWNDYVENQINDANIIKY